MYFVDNRNIFKHRSRKFLKCGAMRKSDRILREVLHRFFEQGERFFNQKGLAETCRLSLGTINPLIAKLEQLGAVERKPLGFRLLDVRRALLYWAIKRDLIEDITYSTFVPMQIRELEASLPHGTVLTAYSGFRAKFDLVPADYKEVFVYADKEEIKKLFKLTSRRKHNLFVLEPDEHLQRLSDEGVATLAQIYVDLWQLGVPASRFVEELDLKLRLTAVKALEKVVKALETKRYDLKDFIKALKMEESKEE